MTSLLTLRTSIAQLHLKKLMLYALISMPNQSEEFQHALCL